MSASALATSAFLALGSCRTIRMETAGLSAVMRPCKVKSDVWPNRGFPARNTRSGSTRPRIAGLYLITRSGTRWPSAFRNESQDLAAIAIGQHIKCSVRPFIHTANPCVEVRKQAFLADDAFAVQDEAHEASTDEL